MAEKRTLYGWKGAGICLLLASLVFVVFGQTIHFGFIGFDDSDYVYENPIILKGLSGSGIEWAFTHVLAGHWHPLTAIALMTEAQFFGSWAGGYHLVNVALHAAGAVLLFLMLLDMTGGLWRSAFAAAVFAIHPLRAESVAWISECKDVLSGVFFMLTLWAYVRYARHPKSKIRYAMALVWLALGLLSKSMLVTTPCVLLLLDYWPLGRLQSISQFPRLLWEKIPLFALSLLSSLAAVLALKSGAEPATSHPANVPIAYVVSLANLVYPNHLALLHPIPKGGWPIGEAAGALLLLALLTAGVWLLRRKEPVLVTGWFWYLGMLLPVSGIMETEGQAYADRYTYLPQIGLCIAGTWLAADWAGERRGRRAALGCAAAAVLCALAFACRQQTTYWHDSVALWTRTLEYTQDNFVAHDGLGDALLQKQDFENAFGQYREAVQINPRDAKAHMGLGNILLMQGRTDEAFAQFHEALKVDPNDAKAHYNLACVLFQQGEMEQGVAECREALRLRPVYAEAHNNLGNALFQLGRADEAIEAYRDALKDNPGFEQVHDNLANALLQQGRMGEAIAEYRAVLTSGTVDLNGENALAWILATTPDEKFRDGAGAVKIAASANQSANGNDPVILHTLAAAYAASGDFGNAVQTAQKALQMAGTQSNAGMAEEIRKEIELYETGRALEIGP